MGPPRRLYQEAAGARAWQRELWDLQPPALSWRTHSPLCGACGRGVSFSPRTVAAGHAGLGVVGKHRHSWSFACFQVLLPGMRGHTCCRFHVSVMRTFQDVTDCWADGHTRCSPGSLR